MRNAEIQAIAKRFVTAVIFHSSARPFASQIVNLVHFLSPTCCLNITNEKSFISCTAESCSSLQLRHLTLLLNNVCKYLLPAVWVLYLSPPMCELIVPAQCLSLPPSSEWCLKERAPPSAPFSLLPRSLFASVRLFVEPRSSDCELWADVLFRYELPVGSVRMAT